jgi:hypothetical protein
MLVLDDEAESIWPNRGAVLPFVWWFCGELGKSLVQIFTYPNKYLSQAPVSNKFEALLLEPTC